jgi:hypothetical protein
MRRTKGPAAGDNAGMLRVLLVLAGVLLVPGDSPAQGRQQQQAVVETSGGTIVLDLLADNAPGHVALFIETAGEGGYDGTVFHRMVPGGIIQGGDPLTKVLKP